MINDLLKVISEAEIIHLVLFLILLALIFVQIVFKIIILVKVINHKDSFRKEQKSPISILMAVRNEEENLSVNLPYLLSFKYPDYEVIVVDDFSQDNTLTVLGKLRETNPKLKFSTLTQETRFSVKLSQNIALKSAKNDWVLFVPPTLKEFQDEWLENISAFDNDSFDTIVHYINVIPSRKIYNKLFRIETFMLYLKSMKYSMFGIPFVFFENNIAFRKEKYFEMGGYGKKIKEPYANLELLINQFLLKKKYRFVLHNDSAIRFSENISRQDFFDLIKKSFRIEKYLSYSKRVLMATDRYLKLTTFLLFVAVIFLFTGVWPIVSITLSFLLILDLLIIKISQNRLNERKIFITSLVYALVMPCFKMVFSWYFNRKFRKQNGRAKFEIV